MLNIKVVIITVIFFAFSICINETFTVTVFMAELRDVWSTTHFITSGQIVNWLQGIAVSPRLTQTVNPHLWLTVMIPRKVSRVITNEVSLSPGHQARKAQNTQNQIKQISLCLTLELVRFIQTVQL